MSWYFYVLGFLAGALLANGVPHFVQGMSGHWFQSPFGRPSGIGESSPVSNAVWGFANLAAGAVLLGNFYPQGTAAWGGWVAFGAGALLLAVLMSLHFGKVRNPGRTS